MAVYFLDSSAVVKRYINEAGSGWVHDLHWPLDRNDIFIAAVTPVEVIAAISRRARAEHVPQGLIRPACALFRHDLRLDYQTIEVDEILVEQAMDLSERHALRGYDAVQLAAACQVQGMALTQGLAPITVVSADLELNEAALAEGLLVEDPNTHI